MAAVGPTESPEALPATFPAELEAIFAQHDEALLAELALLAEMPQVQLTDKSVYDRARPPGRTAQLRGVQFRLRCCSGPPLVKKCNDLTGDKACPTVLDAARYLRAEVNKKHGSDTCVALALQKLAQEGCSAVSATERPRDAFAAMLGARLAIQRTRSALKQADQSAERRRAQAREAQRLLEEVSFCARTCSPAPLGPCDVGIMWSRICGAPLESRVQIPRWYLILALAGMSRIVCAGGGGT